MGFQHERSSLYKLLYLTWGNFTGGKKMKCENGNLNCSFAIYLKLVWKKNELWACSPTVCYLKPE